MHDDQDQLSHVSEGLAEVLARLEAAREALQPLLDGQDGDLAWALVRAVCANRAR